MKKDREYNLAFQKSIVEGTKVITVETGVFRIVTQYSDSKGQTHLVEAMLLPVSKIDLLPKPDRETLLQYYRKEFDRTGSYMQLPIFGNVVAFSVDGLAKGFFFYGEDEFIGEEGVIPSVLKHLQSGVLKPHEVPRSLSEIFLTYARELGSYVSFNDMFQKVVRPMRFYIYPWAQGGGSLNILNSLITITASILNPDVTEIHQVIEARAGLTPGAKGSRSARSDHQLVEVYIKRGYHPVILDDTPVVWQNTPYYNASLGQKIQVPETLKLLELE